MVEFPAESLFWASCPYEAQNKRMLSNIAVNYAQEYTRVFLDRFADELEQATPDLPAILHGWSRTKASFDEVWDTSFGRIVESVRMTPGDGPEALALAAALHLARHGMHGQWTARLSRPCALRFGEWVFDDCAVMKVRSDATSVSIDVKTGRGGGGYSFSRVTNDWSGPAPRRLPAFGRNRPGIVVLGGGDGTGEEFDSISGPIKPRIEDSDQEQLDAALDLLQRHVPEYAEWVEGAIRHVIVMRTGERTMNSGSSGLRPGAIHMDMPPGAVRVCEVLVHEATHQYYHAARCLVKDHHDPEGKTYYSPIKRTERPMRGILVAYHAFANVYLLHAKLRAFAPTEEQRTYIDGTMRQVAEQLVHLRDSALSSGTLGPLGLAVVEPLDRRLNGLAYER